MRAPPLSRHARSKQHGAALMIMVVLMVVGLISILVSSLNSSALQSARQGQTAAALAQAKSALIGRAVSDNYMPGSLPCPDTNDDGSAESFAGNDCPSYIGRLPWRTLKLPDLRDGSGERLWYVLSPNFRDSTPSRYINSNTKGTLLVYSADGLSLQTEAGYDAVAVIFAPGSPFGSQTRKTVAQQNSAANYLDSIVIPGPITRNNATAGGPFIAGAKSDTFNDQILFITTKNLMPLVEQRVAGVVKQALTDYYAATRSSYYPWADSVDQATDYDSNDGYNRGWLPRSASVTTSPTTIGWLAGSPPQWFFDNQWYTLIYYSVAKSLTRNPGGCNSPFCTENTLSVNYPTNTGVRVLFFMPGTPIGTMERINVPAITTLSNYLEDPENQDGLNDRYDTPTSQSGDRDRLYWLSSSSIWNR